MDEFHDTVYEEVIRLSELVGVQESSPRLASRQQHRSNIPSGNVKEHQAKSNHTTFGSHHP